MDTQKKALKKLGLETIEDLLYYFPVRYGDMAQVKNIVGLSKGDHALVYGKISHLKLSKGWKSKIPMAEAIIEDESGKIKAIWFHQPYIAKMLHDGDFVKMEGKVAERKGILYFTNPETEQTPDLPIAVGSSLFGQGDSSYSYPVYAESRGITSKWFFHAIQKIFKSGIIDSLKEPLPQDMLKKYNLPSLASAIVWVHTPKKESDSISARKRFAFQEIFFIQLEKQKERQEYQNKKSFKITKTEKEMADFIGRFPFEPTEAQKKAIETILSDFAKNYPMSRLLEGDVGSGKTAVAASAVYATTTTRPHDKDYGNLQTAYMAPTEILASQHFESFIKYFAYTGIQIGLITGSGCKKFPSKVSPTKATDISRAQLLKWVANGEIPIIVGTHALIQKTVKFKNLAFVVIDEQHRFGTAQRQKLRHKDDILPHLLSMTATPIPRTLALTIYGDLDITLLDQMPHGRKPIITEIVLPNQRKNTYDKIREELKAGRQVYIICPRIDEPDPTKEGAILAKSVNEEAKRLKKDIFPEYEIDILHSKMTPTEKDKVMEKFKNGKTHILVATSVVEVGVNVPNATVIIIEGGERFGLSQLHQLRGRVIRSNHQAYCYVFAEAKSEKTIDRLKALKTAKNGFELAEFDLSQRGSGLLYGQKQWGVSDLAMEGIKNIKMVEAARAEAKEIIEKDSELNNHTEIKEYYEANKRKIHFE